MRTDFQELKLFNNTYRERKALLLDGVTTKESRASWKRRIGGLERHFGFYL
jgi:hypothetical protein